jgi:hypothetical protein
MRNLLLAYLLGILSAASFAAVAAKRDDDILGFYDKEKTSGATIRRVSVCQHDEYTSEWSTVRSAAAQSLSALDGWYANQGDATRAAWWIAMGQGKREDYRQAILSLAP